VEISSQKNPVLSLVIVVIVVIVIFSTQPTSKEEKEALGSVSAFFVTNRYENFRG